MISWTRKVVESTNLIKLVFRSVKMFWEKTRAKRFRLECPFQSKSLSKITTLDHPSFTMKFSIGKKVVFKQRLPKLKKFWLLSPVYMSTKVFFCVWKFYGSWLEIENFSNWFLAMFVGVLSQKTYLLLYRTHIKYDLVSTQKAFEIEYLLLW